MNDRRTLGIEEIQSYFDASPFTSLLGLWAVHADARARTLTVRMPPDARLERSRGAGRFHGGAIATLIDVAGDFAVGMLVGGAVPTVNLRVDFSRPAVNGELIAYACVKHLGRTLSIADIELIDRSGALVALGRGTYLSIPA